MKSLKENLLLYKHKDILFALCLNFCVFRFGEQYIKLLHELIYNRSNIALT
jgi:hypothetical protein